MAERKRKTEETEKRQRKAYKIIEIEEAQKRRKEKRSELKKQEKAMRRREKNQERASRPRMSSGKKAAALGVLAVAVLIFVFNGYHIFNLNLDKAVYEKQYEERVAERTRLEKELNSVDDREYVEQQARDRFHMLKEGEILYIFPEKETAEVQ